MTPVRAMRAVEGNELGSALSVECAALANGGNSYMQRVTGAPSAIYPDVFRGILLLRKIIGRIQIRDSGFIGKTSRVCLRQRPVDSAQRRRELLLDCAIAHTICLIRRCLHRRACIAGI